MFTSIIIYSKTKHQNTDYSTYKKKQKKQYNQNLKNLDKIKAIGPT